jgi:hypothetical protein
MTEPEWLACTEPYQMLAFLRDNGQLTDRKARLFGVAVCRRLWHLLADERSRTAVEVSERHADGLVGKKPLAAARRAAFTVCKLRPPPRFNQGGVDGNPEEAAQYYAAHMALQAAGRTDDLRLVASIAGNGSGAAFCLQGQTGQEAEGRVIAAFLRDLLGPLPFRPLAVAPSALRWQGGTVVHLAQAAYDARRMPAGTLEPERLAVLADALEEGGCADEAILGHLRERGAVHIRGCFVLDLLLGKG